MSDERQPAHSETEDDTASPAGVLQGDRGIEAALVWIGAFVIAALAVLAGLPAFRIPLNGNDLLLFAESDALHRIVTWPAAMAQLPGAPLTLFGFAANWSLSGGSVAAMHAGNLLLHALNGILVFLVCRRLFARPIPEAIAMIAGLVFVAIPLSVSWTAPLATRPILQALCFALLAVLAYQHGTTGSATRPGWVIVAAWAYALAAASQIGFVALPVVIIAVSLIGTGLEGLTRHRVAHGALLFLMVFLAVARWAAVNATDSVEVVQVIETPAGYLYYAIAAIAVVLPWGIALLQVPPLRVAAGSAAGIAVLAGAYLSYLDYERRTDPIGWWHGIAEANPDDPAAYEHLVRYQMAAPNAALDEVAAALQELRRLEPENAWAAEELGRVLFAQQAVEPSLAASIDALRLNPFAGEAAFHAALATEAQYQTTRDRAKLRDALDFYARADALGVLDTNQSLRYGFALRNWGDLEKSYSVLARAQGSEVPEQIMEQIRQVQAGVQALREARKSVEEKLASNDPMAGLQAQASVSLVEGAPLTAFYIAERVLANDPENVKAWVDMGVSSGQLGYADQFLARYGTPAGDFKRWGDLAARSAATNAWEAAEEYLRFAASHIEDAPIAEVTLARIAISLRQIPRAESLLSVAVESNPASAEPLLLRADLMLATGRPVEARTALEEARGRGASEEAIKAREEQLVGQEPKTPSGPVRTILQ